MDSIRPIDANHLLSRLKPPTNKEDFVIHQAVKNFIESEVTLEKYKDPKNEIQWIPAKREKRTLNVHAVSYGVECSRCHCFQSYTSRFCQDCGGWFDGEIFKKNSYAERKNFGRI